MTTAFSNPSIIRETSAGIERTSIYEEMLLDRQLAVTGEIGPEMAMDITQHLLRLEREDGESPVTVFVSSPGGSVSAGLAIYDALRAVSCPVRTVCTELAASMGSIVFLAGETREMLPHAEVMIHDPLIQQGAGGSALSVQEASRRLMARREILNGIISERTGLTREDVDDLTAKDTYLDAERALELGFATDIISSRKEG